MEHCDARGGLRSSWEEVLEMPDKADAAQEDCQQKQEASEAGTPKEKQAGQLRMPCSPCWQALPTGSGLCCQAMQADGGPPGQTQEGCRNRSSTPERAV